MEVQPQGMAEVLHVELKLTTIDMEVVLLMLILDLLLVEMV